MAFKSEFMNQPDPKEISITHLKFPLFYCPDSDQIMSMALWTFASVFCCSVLSNQKVPTSQGRDPSLHLIKET